MKKGVWGALLLMTLQSCTTNPEILKIRSLSEPVTKSESIENNGEIIGLERLSTDKDGKIKANILVIHGMGWTTPESDDKQVGFDVLRAIETRYGITGTLKHVKRLCPQRDAKGRPLHNYPHGGLLISNKYSALQTDAPMTYLNSVYQACLDKINIDLGKKGLANLYRLFWDDSFYNSYEYPNLGYDDSIYYDHEDTNPKHIGYEHIDEQRSFINRKIKTSLVTYGFSDATMYLGPVGELIRETIRGGICAAINDATGQDRYFQDSTESGMVKSQLQYIRASTEDLCQLGKTMAPAPLVIVTKSLGSRVVFDVLTRDRTPELTQKLEQVSNQEIEVFMLANQIPLLAVGRLSELKKTPAQMSKRLKFIAVSEINDLLTYELVPYFEHLYYLRCVGTREINPDNEKDCKAADPSLRMNNFRKSRELRKQFVSEMGFNVVDIRAKYAPPLIPFVPFADPNNAHTDQMEIAPIRDIFFCGVDKGNIRTRNNGCEIY